MSLAGLGKRVRPPRTEGVVPRALPPPSPTLQTSPFHNPPLSDPSSPLPSPPPSSSLIGLVKTQPAASSPSASLRVTPVQQSPSPSTHAAEPSTSTSPADLGGTPHWPGLSHENRSWRIVYDPLVEGPVDRSNSSAPNGTATRPGSKDLVFSHSGRDGALGTGDGSLDVPWNACRTLERRRSKVDECEGQNSREPPFTIYPISGTATHPFLKHEDQPLGPSCHLRIPPHTHCKYQTAI